MELLRRHGMVLARQRRWDEAERASEEAVSVAGPYATRTPRRALYLWDLMYVDDPDRKRGRERLEEAAEISLEAGIAIVLGTDSGGDDRAELTP